MDKYLNITGLELLCDPKKKKKKKQGNNSNRNGKVNLKFIDTNYLHSFKKFMYKKIDKFNPTKKYDNFDTLLVSLWHQYIFNDVDESKYYEYVKILNSSVENSECIIKKNLDSEEEIININKLNTSLEESIDINKLDSKVEEKKEIININNNENSSDILINANK